jgi:hypothetical protein
MLSVLFSSRAKGNPDSGLARLLDTAAEHVRPDERDKIEFLIKFDDDDDQRMPDAELAKYPFRVRPFCWSRGEGRHGLHHAQEYLFTQRDPRSRFLLMTADDFIFDRTGFVSDILAVKDEFIILGCCQPPVESFAGRYEQEAVIRKWVTSIGNLSPVISARLIEVCQNFGWQSNVDSWLIGLAVVLYDLYGVNIWRTLPEFYRRRGGYGLGDTPTYNNMEITSQKGPFNRYWFELVRRQARNVYLNMMHGTDHGRRSFMHLPRRLWQKIWAQPLSRLPYRAFHLARRGVMRLAGYQT